MLEKTTRHIFNRELIKNVPLAFHNDRRNCVDSFRKTFTKVKNLCHKYEMPLMILRRSSRQNHRKNYPIIYVESYFHQFIYVSHVESI